MFLLNAVVPCKVTPCHLVARYRRLKESSATNFSVILLFWKTEVLKCPKRWTVNVCQCRVTSQKTKFCTVAILGTVMLQLLQYKIPINRLKPVLIYMVYIVNSFRTSPIAQLSTIRKTSCWISYLAVAWVIVRIVRNEYAIWAKYGVMKLMMVHIIAPNLYRTNCNSL
jgi:hypothetical protein